MTFTDRPVDFSSKSKADIWVRHFQLIYKLRVSCEQANRSELLFMGPTGQKYKIWPEYPHCYILRTTTVAYTLNKVRC